MGLLIHTDPDEARRRLVAVLKDARSLERASWTLRVSRSTLYTWLDKLHLVDYSMRSDGKSRDWREQVLKPRESVMTNQELSEVVGTVIRARLAALETRLVEDVMAVLHETLDAIAVGVVKSQSGTPPEHATPSPAPSTQLATRNEDRLLDLLAGCPNGLRMRLINKHLGTSPGELVPVIHKLVSQRRIRVEGQRRAMTYFAV